MSNAAKNRAAFLDILRAAAIFLVLGNHIEINADTLNPVYCKILGAWKCGGWIGVDLFFVLSGFLISGLLFSELDRFGKISFRNFFIRRGFKIYPSFYVMILFTAVFKIKFHQFSLRYLVSECLFIQNYFGAMLNHTWSLAVEEHFYIFLPILFIVLSRTSSKKIQGSSNIQYIPQIFMVLALGCLVARALTVYFVRPYSYLAILIPTHLRIDALFFGVLLSYLHRYKSLTLQSLIYQKKALFFFFGLLLCAPAFFYDRECHPVMMIAGCTIVYVGFGAILLSLLYADVRCEHPFARSIALIGSRSYSIYLWHEIMRIWGLKVAERIFGQYYNWHWYLISYIAGSVGIGLFMFKFVESPFLRLRDGICPSRSLNI